MSHNQKHQEKKEGQPMTEQEARQSLALLLLLLSGWEEDSRKNPGQKIFRSWKGYLFEDLNGMETGDMIVQFPKSVVITEKGLEEAQNLKERVYSLLGVQDEG